LALGHVLRKKEKIKEEERQSMKCAEGTQTEEGSKWLKKHKRRSEVKESKSLKEKIKEDKATKKIDHGQVSKRKKTLMGALEHLAEKKEEQVGEVLKMWVMWT
jgi:flagellar biosynthesis/type III secretory pathway M-ring protein FliF/YscJ